MPDGLLRSFLLLRLVPLGGNTAALLSTPDLPQLLPDRRAVHLRRPF